MPRTYINLYVLLETYGLRKHWKCNMGEKLSSQRYATLYPVAYAIHIKKRKAVIGFCNRNTLIVNLCLFFIQLTLGNEAYVCCCSVDGYILITGYLPD